MRNRKKIFFLFLNQNMCWGYSKEPSQWDDSFEHPKHMLKNMGKKIFTILHRKVLFILLFVVMVLLFRICLIWVYIIWYRPICLTVQSGVACGSPFCEKFLCVLSHGVTALKWHDQLTAISAHGDGDEVVVSYDRSSLIFETATEDNCTTTSTLV